MKKYLKWIIILFIFLIIIGIVLIIYRKNSFYAVVDNTIKNKDKLNYVTNIELTSTYSSGNMKIEYESIKYSSIRKITINNYINDELQNNLLKYVQDNKTYVYDDGKYEEKDDLKDDFNIKYKYLKDKLLSIKSKSGNKFIIKMNKVDAYNLIYDKDILTEDKTNGTTNVTIIVNDKYNFIEEISYEIDDLDIYNNKDNLSKYKVKITNKNINEVDEIKLPVKKSE